MELVKKRKNGNIMVRCKICSKNIRSDTVKRHQRTHKDLHVMDEQEVRVELRARQECAMEREQKRQLVEEIARQEGISIDFCTDVSGPSTSSVLSDIETDTLLIQLKDEYVDIIKNGEKIAHSLNKGIGLEEALQKEQKDALDLYRKNKSRVDMETADLRQWQKQLIEILQPSNRHIYWVVGRKGDEGKSWFQDYLLSKYKYSRAVQLDVCSKPADIFYILSHRPLQTTELFMFNDTRSQDEVSYVALEQIKDGRASSTKYSSQLLNFKRPNIVIVFSNRRPVRANLSADRWREYHITKAGVLELKK